MNSSSDRAASPLVVLALPGLDWSRLQSPMERGELPRFTRLIEQGTWAPVAASGGAAVSTWTTFATGVAPRIHGVLHPIERLEDTLFARAVDALSSRVPGFATMAARAGRRVASVGWPATDGLVLADGWAIGPGADLAAGAQDDHGVLDPRTAHPAAAADAVRALRLQARDLGNAELAFFLEPLAPAQRARVAPSFAVALARTSARHAWATEALAALPADAVLLHLPLLADVAPLLTGLGEAADAVHLRCLRFIDLALAAYLERGEPPRVLLLSDAAFAIAAGPGVARDRMVDPLPATAVFDLMAALGALAPAGRSPPPEVEAFLDTHAPAHPTPHPPPPGPLGPADFPDDVDAHPTPDDLRRLAVAPAIDWTPWREAARAIRRNTLLALAGSVAETGSAHEALAILRPLVDSAPAFLPARALAARLAWSLGRLDEFAALAEAGRRLHGDGVLGDTAALLGHLATRDWPAFDAQLKRAMAADVWVINLHTVAAHACQLRGDLGEAVACLQAAVAREPRDGMAWGALGDAWGRLGRHAEATSAHGRAVSLQPGLRAPLMKLSEAQGRAGDRDASMRTLLRAGRARA